MLVLARKQGEAIHIGDNIVIKISEASNNRVKLCIDAPHEIRIVRGEVAERAKVAAEQQKRLRVAHQPDPKCVLQ